MRVRKLERTFPQAIASEVKMAWEYIKVNISAEAELRVSFSLQVIGMGINNISLVAIWVFFMSAFGQINGWRGEEVIALQGFAGTTYGIAFTFFSGALDLPIAINNGAFDSILLTPRNLYLRSLTISSRASAFGDLLYGIILIAGYCAVARLTIYQAGLMISLLIPAVLIITNFALLSACIAFFVPDADALAKNAFDLMLGPSLYPSGVYQGTTRVIFLFVLPSIAVAGLPVEAVKGFDLVGVLIVWLLAAVWSIVTVFVLKQGIKRYESGNLTGARI